MARLVVAMNWRPADYWALTVAEREAIIAELNDRAERAKP